MQGGDQEMEKKKTFAILKSWHETRGWMRERVFPLLQVGVRGTPENCFNSNPVAMQYFDYLKCLYCTKIINKKTMLSQASNRFLMARKCCFAF